MSYSTIEPTVIDEDLIKKAINEQINPDIADLAKKEGIEANEVSHLRLDYKNLSFNNITVIEGLETLTKLTDLTLFNNRISKIENMDELVNLQVFSIGNNNLTVLESLAYLIKFENLRVLHAAGNPIFKHPNYKNYCLAHLRNLKYLDYRLVDPESVATAKEKYIDSIIALEEEESAAKVKKEASRKQAELDAQYDKAHILKIDNLFDLMFNEDPDFKKLLPIAPTIINDMKEEFKAKFDIVLKEFKLFVMKKTQEKDEEVAMIEGCIADVLTDANKENLVKLERFYHQKKELIKIVQNSRAPKEVDEALKELRDMAKSMSNYLMHTEMVIVEQFEEVIKEFERNYTELCNAISEYGQSAFARLRDLETEHLEKFTEAIMGMYDRFNKGDIEEVDEDIRDIMSDKDQLSNAINSSHDFRLGKLDTQEEALLTGCAKDQEEMIKKLHQTEIKRNRDRVGEIISLMEKTQNDIDFAEENSY